MSHRLMLLLVVMLAPISGLVADTTYVGTPRDTGLPPAAINFDLALEPAYELLAQNDALALHYREDRGVLAIVDRRNGYVWKTGLDIAFKRDLDDLVDEGVDPLSLPPVEERLNTTYTGIANSIVSIEYYDGANNVKRIGSAAHRDVASILEVRSYDPFLAELSVDFQDLDISLIISIELADDELVFRIADENVTGQGVDRLSSVSFAPFMGASGGSQLLWDTEEEDWETSRPRELIPGYAVVPDGSGALVRFADNTADLSEFQGDVYGWDLSQSGFLRSFGGALPPVPVPVMPLFGIVHGNEQNAFAAYATSGAEYMELWAFPEENTTYYTWAHPRFIYNRLYFQVYNKKGDGFFRMLEERNRFDVELRYRFLSDGPGSYDANYAGIALMYRDVLKAREVLPRREKPQSGNIPLRVDFIMSDVRKSVIGYTPEITTTIAQVEEIVLDLESAGVEEMSVGLHGYARGGTVLARPGTLRLLSALGSNREFRDTIGGLARRGIDVSMARDYLLIAQDQIAARGNAIRGASGWYLEHFDYDPNALVELFYYARPDRVTDWIHDDAKDMRDLGVTSLSLGLVLSNLHSDYSDDPALSVSEVIDHYTTEMAEEGTDLGLNLVWPNQYIWSQTRRFLDISLFSTQFLIETDTVPLLQMVLQGSMEMFAPYSNFSFSSVQDVLRMIDYNVYPSFMLTAEPAHLLMMTNSSEYYSTEYSLYRELILDVYGRVNSALREVLDASWVNREVAAEGVIINTYDNGVQIVINYTESRFTHLGETVGPRSAEVFHDAIGSAP